MSRHALRCGVAPQLFQRTTVVGLAADCWSAARFDQSARQPSMRLECVLSAGLPCSCSGLLWAAWQHPRQHPAGCVAHAQLQGVGERGVDCSFGRVSVRSRAVPASTPFGAVHCRFRGFVAGSINACTISPVASPHAFAAPVSRPVATFLLWGGAACGTCCMWSASGSSGICYTVGMRTRTLVYRPSSGCVSKLEAHHNWYRPSCGCCSH